MWSFCTFYLGENYICATAVELIPSLAFRTTFRNRFSQKLIEFITCTWRMPTKRLKVFRFGRHFGKILTALCATLNETVNKTKNLQ